MTACIAAEAAARFDQPTLESAVLGDDASSQMRQFREDVLAGLGASAKTLPSRWLYDDLGSELFEAITAVEPYYPTRTEVAILTDRMEEISTFAGPNAAVIEYGAGAARKTLQLLAGLDRPSAYVPVDIAGDFLMTSVSTLEERYRVFPVIADFTQDFALPELPTHDRRVAFFPGSTLGNLDRLEAGRLLQRMHAHVRVGGAAIIGIDLIKDVDVLIAAYDDADGVTAAFDLNYLTRINRELEGNLQPRQFKHEARWNVREQAIEMHLVSLETQTVIVAGHEFRFEPQETIHTESSRKYNISGIERLATDSGWEVRQLWTDRDKLFAVVGLVAV